MGYALEAYGGLADVVERYGQIGGHGVSLR